MYQTILVPLDGSNSAEITLPYAAQLAAKLGVEITVVSVSESTATDVDHLYRSYLERIKEQIRSQLKDYGAKEEAKAFGKILLGKPADEILRYAGESNAGLILMASRGSSGRGPWLLGNIAAKILRATDKPVMLVRSPASEATIQEKGLIKRILVPLDGSKIGEAALPLTGTLAQALGAEITLFQVLELFPAGEDSAYRPKPRDDESRKASALAYLNSVAKPLKDRGLKTSTVAVVGFPADQIVDFAKANAIDLIAMSTHGRSGIGRWVFGSVTDKVLHAGDTVVLVVRPSKA